MTKVQALKEFNQIFPPETFVKIHHRPSGPKKIVDKGLRDELWGQWIDELCKEGTITDHQYSTWASPWD